MKKYKLIQTYPGSPAIGTVSKPIKSIHGDNNHYWCGAWFNPANYPKHWEEVVEKDYEILSFKTKQGNILKYGTKVSSGEMHPDWIIMNEMEINKYPYFSEIHSVKRVS